MRDIIDQLGPVRGVDACLRRNTGRPLVVEVGCGGGEAALAFARAHPGTDLLAVDVHYPGIVRLLEAGVEEELENLFTERADAVELLDDGFGPSSLAGVHFFFPDPWPKTRHHKRRFVRPDVLDLIADRLAPGADLLVATDVDDYVAWARHHLDTHRYFVGGEVPRPTWRPVTRYEAAGLDAGRTVVDLGYTRR